LTATTCECGATVTGGSWHLKQHQQTQRHRDALAFEPTLAPSFSGGLIPPLQLVDPPQEQPRATLRRMADVLRGRHPAEPTATEAFDGATLDLGPDAPPIWPRNPVPVGDEPRRGRTPRTLRGRPPGAEDLTPLFATGLVLLTTFAVGGWAAPTPEEASAISVPLANIMARRIDLAAKLGRDASDTIALAVALTAYGIRVVPLASERVRDSLERRNSERASRAGVRRDAAEPPHDQGADGVASSQGNGADTSGGPTFDPFYAIAQARAAGLRVLGDLPVVPSDGGPPVAGGGRQQ
jgi:hypothetical protein